MKERHSVDRLSKYVDILQSNAEYTFSEGDALKSLSCSVIAFRNAARRLIVKNRIARIRKEFYVIVPLEYKSAGIPSPHWYIDSLMRDYFRLSYYVGLLSAAASYGASHQQPQIFQVITTKPLKPIILPRTHIRFYVKKQVADQFLIKKNTPAGFMNVSSVELTALDLIKYVNSSGHLNNIVTVLIELADLVNVDRLLEIAKQFPVTTAQRFGYLLENFTHLNLESLNQWLKEQSMRTTVLVPENSQQKFKKNNRWKIWINEHVEPDL